MNRVCLFIIFVSSIVMGYSQKTTKVSATYTYYAPESMSVEEAKRVALDRAKIQAIADAFGTVVMQETSTYVKNAGDESDINFFSTGLNEVKGEWVATTEEPQYSVSYTDGFLVVKVAVKGKARTLERTKIPLIVRILRNGTERKYEDDGFLDGDDMYLMFQSPIAGHILVYLIDHTEDKVYCLLPYSSSKDSSQTIEGNKEYVFFSGEKNLDTQCESVDQYTLESNSPSGIDYNDIVIFFSPNQLIKSNSTRVSHDTPRLLSLEEFKTWKAELQAITKDIQIINKPIIIKKN